VCPDCLVASFQFITLWIKRRCPVMFMLRRFLLHRVRCFNPRLIDTNCTQARHQGVHLIPEDRRQAEEQLRGGELQPLRAGAARAADDQVQVPGRGRLHGRGPGSLLGPGASKGCWPRLFCLLCAMCILETCVVLNPAVHWFLVLTLIGVCWSGHMQPRFIPPSYRRSSHHFSACPPV
jgi:hypothetical protein